MSEENAAVPEHADQLADRVERAAELVDEAADELHVAREIAENGDDQFRADLSQQLADSMSNYGDVLEAIDGVMRRPLPESYDELPDVDLLDGSH